MSPDTPTEVGRYVVLGRLGRGGMGDVLEAELQGPAGFRKKVALKLLRTDGTGAGTSDDLVREARLGAMMAHPNVVGVFELGEADGHWFVAMELVRGAALGALMRGFGALSPRATLDIGIQACAGIAHIHGLEIEGRTDRLVHRDIKPGNLLIDRSGLVKVADFGIASVTGDQTRDAPGTPGYMAPEHVRGEAEPRSDLFSLGAVLAACATGEPLLGRGFKGLVKLRHSLADLPTLLAPVDAAIPGLAPVLERCLAPDPADRYSSAAGLADALQSLVPAHPTGLTLLDMLATLGAKVRRGEQVTGARGAPRPAPRAGDSTSGATPETVRLGNLPTPADRFLGRTSEVSALSAMLGGRGPLVTLSGPGGVGKTRLALEAASRAGTFPGAAWWCDLTEARTEADVCAAVGTLLHLRLPPSGAAEAVGAELARRGRMLLLLDNCESCVGPLAELLSPWRAAAPELVLLATSRVPLQISGERLVPVQPLDSAAALSLLVDRAHGAVDSDDPVAAQLVEALDRLPLAIELVAARTRLLPLHQVAKRLEQRFRVVAGGGRERPERHRTLWAAIDGSWELLPEWARGPFAAMSVFGGGFSLEAVEAVIPLAPDAPWALEVLDVLASHSLLTVDPERGRFGLLSSIRDYAAARLDEADRVAVERSHGAYFARLVDGVLDSPRDPDALLPDLENLRLAAQRAAARGEPELALFPALAASRLYRMVGPVLAALEVDEMMLGSKGLSDDSRSLLERARATSLLTAGRLLEAKAQMQEADARYQPSSQRVRGLMARTHGAILLRLGDLESAERYCRHALELARASEPADIWAAEFNLGLTLHRMGNLPGARAHYAHVTANKGQSLDPRLESSLWNTLGHLHHADGEQERALEAFDTARRRALEVHHDGMAANCLTNRAEVLLAMGRPEEARRAAEAGLRGLQLLGNEVLTTYTRGVLAGIALALGEVDEAQRLIEEHRTGAVRSGMSVLIADSHGYRGRLAAHRGERSACDEAFADAMRAASTSGELPRLMTLRIVHAESLVHLGDIQAAQRLVQSAEIDPDHVGRDLLRRAEAIRAMT